MQTLVQILEERYDGRCQRVDLEAEGFTAGDISHALSNGCIQRETPKAHDTEGIWADTYLVTSNQGGKKGYVMLAAIRNVMDAYYGGRRQRVDLEAEGFTVEQIWEAIREGVVKRESPLVYEGEGLWSCTYLATV